MEKYSEQIQQLIADLPDGADKDLTPCTEDEVSGLEAMLPKGLELPLALKAFLSVGGHKTSRLFNSVDFSYNSLKIALENGNRDAQRMLNIWSKGEELPHDFFLLNEYQGSSLTYILLEEGENPPVYFWEEGGKGLEEAEEESASFIEFISLRISNYSRLASRS